MKNFLKLLHNKARNNHFAVGIVIVVLTAFCFIIFTSRFVSIATSKQFDGVNLADKTRQKYQHVDQVNARRGDILDTNGDMIAGNSSIFDVYAVLSTKAKTSKGKPDYVQDKVKTAFELSKYLPLSKKQILDYLNPTNKKQYQVEFGPEGRNLSIEIKNKIAALHLQGIKFNEYPSRAYPNGVFATNQVGITQQNNINDPNTNISGLMGIERSYNKVLSGTGGKKITKIDSQGNELPGSEVVEKQAVNGSNVYLTLDSKIQQYVEILTQNVQNKYQPKDLQVLVMDSKTGQIKAATQRPTFNPSTGKGMSESWRDTLVADQFEPGSVMKILTMSAAIDSGNYDPNSYYQSGTVEVGGRTIKDWNDVGWGSIPLYEAFPRSSNVGMVHLEQTMGADTWMKYMKKFKIGDKTGIELPDEIAGGISYKHASDQAMTSFGQSVNVNDFQMLQAFSAVANNGKMVKPQLVKKIVDPNTGKTTQKFKTDVVGHPISADTATQVRNAMRQVITADYGTGAAYKIPGISVGVKTGTAQVASPAGGYLTGASNYIFSVAGMVPYKNPRYIVYITMKQPQIMSTAAEKMIAEIFNPLVKRLMTQEDESGVDVKAGSQYVDMPDFLNSSVEDAQKKITKLNLQSGIVGTGDKIVQQLPASGEKVMPGQRIVMLTNGAMTMPDLTGWSKNDVLKFAEITGRTVVTKGDGYVTEQSIKAGQIINDSGKITVTLKNNN
ncbi:penicillin-binding transpeptidase domain-containing protein [Companilactobacillus ginsenosidimutans]|uniref:Penicillin-binding protein n=1 Tax=Companilactobacillus ginsenosidimutans TaxID=1007676 RepID=A0A0H4QIE2_9LACO|nr:penicillin-binding transpeptidase domain-containing protein [Companilactobacillus ginsenosidimutans]AKP66408.1 penicillin-binding protein [Companilactobacillus ginsenosidimutans]